MSMPWNASPIDVLIPGRERIAFRLAGRRVDRSCHVLELGEGLSWDRPEAIGSALGERLASLGVGPARCRRVVLPGEWTVSRTASLPPAADASLVAGMIEIEADKLFAERSEDLRVGFAASSANGTLEVSIVACHRDRLAGLGKALASAGLRADRIVPLAPALAATLKDDASRRALVIDALGRVEVALAIGRRVVWTRDTGAGGDRPERLAVELRRAAASCGPGDLAELLVAGPETTRLAACEAFGLEARAMLPAGGATAGAEPDAGCQAVALAGQADVPSVETLDLLGSWRQAGTGRWTPLLRRVALAAGAAVLALGVVGAMWYGHLRRAQRARTRLAAIAEEVADARRLGRLTEATDAWHAPNPGYLDAMRELTTRFPVRGTIWLSSLRLDERGRLTVSGKARDRGEVLELIARLREASGFTDVEPHFVRTDGGGSGVSFALSCRYQAESGS